MSSLNLRKDEKIQIYYTDTKAVEASSTVTKKFRHYIYGENIYNSGGLWANVKSVKQAEIVSNGLSLEMNNIQVIVNRNDKISSTQKIVYRGKVYDIKGSPDQLDFRSKEIKFLATQTTDTTKYAGDIFDE